MGACGVKRVGGWVGGSVVPPGFGWEGLCVVRFSYSHLIRRREMAIYAEAAPRLLSVSSCWLKLHIVRSAPRAYVFVTPIRLRVRRIIGTPIIVGNVVKVRKSYFPCICMA